MTRKKENAILIAVAVVLLFIGWFNMVDGPKWAKQRMVYHINQIDFMIDKWNASVRQYHKDNSK